MTLSEIEKSISQLSADELARFREWFLDFDTERWDAQIERDAKHGLLDARADAALREHRSGNSKPL